MNILSPEAIALLKRQDADDALQAAALAGWNKAIEAAAKTCDAYARDSAPHTAGQLAGEKLGHGIRSLAKQENTK